MNLSLRSAATVWMLAAGALRAGELAEHFDLPPGFVIELFADDALAHDIFSMTIDSRGQLVVSGPGYVKRLLDDDHDGRADRAELVSSFPRSGAQGMYFDGPDLIVTGDNVLARLRDADGDGIADAKPEVWARLHTSEHGAHAVVLGPDGWFYVVCGNDAGVSTDHVRSAVSPVKRPHSGTILRLSRDGTQRQVIAHGFRNPYDLAFSPTGALFTVDSDGERDHHLPWYAPTRLFDVGIGREHGWLVGGWINSWSRPEWFYDNVSRSAELGRGSPTGLICYEHRQFPERYWGGLFSADWTFGRIYFLPLTEQGSGFASTPEVFAQSRGEHGFAPVDLEIGPAGELFIAMGGRKTQGSVFRVRYANAPPVAAKSREEGEGSEVRLMNVLACDQPLSSWSRAAWAPLARQIGAEAFRSAALNGKTLAHRIRAIEVLTELFGGIDAATARSLMKTGEPHLTARTAWALGRAAKDAESQSVLGEMASDRNITVTRAAWEALLLRPEIHWRGANLPWTNGLDSDDDRVRWGAMLLARRARKEGCQAAINRLKESSIAIRLAERWITQPETDGDSAWSAETARVCQEVFPGIAEVATTAPRRLLEVLRLLELSLGDVVNDRSSAAEPVGYVARHAEWIEARDREAMIERLNDAFPTGVDTAEYEIARLLAMLQGGSPGLADKLAQRFRAQGRAEEDLHFLFALSRVGGARSASATEATAAALLDLDQKLRRRGELASRNWPQRVGELFEGLSAKDGNLPEVMARRPEFGSLEHVLFASRLPRALQPAAARRILQRWEEGEGRDESTPWPSELVGLVTTLPTGESLSLLRRGWNDPGVRDTIALALAKERRPEDRARLIEALASYREDVVAACCEALCRMPGALSDDECSIARQALERFCSVGRDAGKASDNRPYAGARHALVALFEAASGERFDIDESSTTDLFAAYQPIFTWIDRRYPGQSTKWAKLDAAGWAARLASIDWGGGDPAAGRRVFEKQSCHRCHADPRTGGTQRLGPDLAGAAERFGREDLFAAIVDPNRTVAPAYQTTEIVTRSGRVYVGLVVYESPDGTLLQTTPDTTVRITGDEFVSMQASPRSLMPEGLLTGLTDHDIRDLYAYLQSLDLRH